MKIEHIILDYSNHFLVIDGKRGPLCINPNSPAIHPSGFIKYRRDAQLSDVLRGAVFYREGSITEGLREYSDTVTEIKDDACEPALEKWKEWVEIQKTCTDIKLARYPEYKEIKPSVVKAGL